MHRSSFSLRRSAATQRGYSLIELSIAMAILSVVIVGSLVGVQRILANNRANHVLQDIPRINASLVAATANSGVAAGISTTQAANLGVFPANIVVRGAANAVTNVRNPFGGNYFIAGNGAAVGSAPVGTGVFIQVSSVPAAMCATIVNGMAPLASGIWVTAAPTATAGPIGSTTVTAIATPAADGDATTVKDSVAGATVNLGRLATQCLNDGSTVVAFMPGA
ncbi:prepilin-type N-terminal cleavage/methylation domain-containing protein [Comamonadaceae bacterium PP-2]